MKDRNPNYWQNKIAAWLYESPLKDFNIVKRDEVAKKTRERISGINFDNIKELVAQAEQIASGLTRAVLPYDDSRPENIKITHPLVKDKSISIKNSVVDVDKLTEEVTRMLETDLAYLVKDTPNEYQSIFNYLFFAFCKQLRKNNVGNLGAYWDILPADTRMPDHPIWHHLGMTSAIYSCLERNETNEADKNNISMVVYSITPVQEFIGKARKLRDYWVGSVLLSYLSFIGITKVMEELGPDHILYPSLHNQALVDIWLGKKDNDLAHYLDETGLLKDLNDKSSSIASFPNKFVFICNKKDVSDICGEIQTAINDEWNNTAGIVKEYIQKNVDITNLDKYNQIWNDTLTNYWKLSWASTNFITIADRQSLLQLLSADKWEREFDIMQRFCESAKKENIFQKYDTSNLYGATHSLAQGLLAAGKMKPMYAKPSQKGEKCPLCGEHEVLNDSPTDIKASDYNKNVTGFWDKLRHKENKDDKNFTQIGEHERLCAVCAVKRLLPMALRSNREHILYDVIVGSYDTFPSTTEMSAYEFLHSDKCKGKAKDIADKLHNSELSSEEEADKLLKDAKGYETKYYAFLLMDGDKMGDLINGETTEATWDDVLNCNKASTLFQNKEFSTQKRTINPALHAMISDSLNNFARYGVQPAVNASGGRLIYAGGDDVCAILPLSKAFETADKIRQAYQLSFAKVTDQGSVSITEPESDMDKIVMHLGHSNDQNKTKISLSGAIIIAHHKQPLKEVIQAGHSVLDGVAKDKSGRNSLAIRLMKRSGGDRDMWFKWEEKNIFADDTKTCRESFEDVIKNAGEKLSASLLYKIENLKGAFEPVLFEYKDGKQEAKKIDENIKKQIVQLFEYEVAHSIIKNKDKANDLARDLAGICIKVKKDDKEDDNKAAENWFNPEAAIIANFLATATPKTEKNNDKEDGNE